MEVGSDSLCNCLGQVLWVCISLSCGQCAVFCALYSYSASLHPAIINKWVLLILMLVVHLQWTSNNII